MREGSALGYIAACLQGDTPSKERYRAEGLATQGPLVPGGCRALAVLSRPSPLPLRRTLPIAPEGLLEHRVPTTPPGMVAATAALPLRWEAEMMPVPCLAKPCGPTTDGRHRRYKDARARKNGLGEEVRRSPAGIGLHAGIPP